MAATAGRPATHEYSQRLVWEGDPAIGTSDYAAYNRQYRVEIAGKPTLIGTADPMFKGDAKVHNPEDLFLAAITGCHMLSYLALCAKHGVKAIAYEDAVTATLELSGGGGRFSAVTLHPRVTIADAAHAEKAKALHDNAHHICFIANSCSVPIHVKPTIIAG